MKHVLKETPAYKIDLEFFSSERWASRPNSTSRLNLVNYQAISLLDDKHDIEFICTNSIGEREARLFSEADFVVVNQVASPGSRQFISKLMEWLRGADLKGKLIFGTELSWFNELSVDRGITQEMVDVGYFDHLLLRHTARTESPLYATERCHQAAIQEFEIGLDTKLLTELRPVKDRRIISFVRAPEGRSTKNNAAIDRLVGRIRASEVLGRYEIKIIDPPYSSLDYWKLMSESAFFVFTSVGETFSYCLNDAKALGAVSFFPEQMYYTAVGRAFAVDAYPRSGLRFRSDDDLIAQMERLSDSIFDLEAESFRGRMFVESEFSVEAISKKWDALFSGESLNRETLLLYDPRQLSDWVEVIAECESQGARLAMPHLNTWIPVGAGSALSWHDNESDIVMLRYYLTERTGAGFTRTIFKSESGLEVGEGPTARHSVDEAARFMQLICRQHKVSKVVIGYGLRGSLIEAALARVRYFAGFGADMRPLDVCVL